MSSIPIFKAGQHTDMQGTRVSVTIADLDACAKAYHPQTHEAPLVIGHPKTDDPAWGWVKALRVEQGQLLAEPQQIDPQFSEMVQQGRFKKVSAAFYLPDAPHNPTPGTLYLRHVGFLGAQPPAIKGLQSVRFSEQEDGVVIFAEDSDSPCDELQSLSLPKENAMTDNEIQHLREENAQLKAQLAAQVAAEAQRQQDAQHAEHVAFSEALVSEGKLSPAAQPVVVALLDEITQGDTSVMFSEGDVTKPLSTAFKEILNSRSPLLAFGEHATKARAEGQPTRVSAEFAEADPARLALHQQALKLAKQENISYDAAVTRCL